MIFSSFSQADNTHTRKFGGTGLGLAIASKLVKLMNGVIGLKSSAGAGAEFWFKIPVGVEGVNSKGGQGRESDQAQSLLQSNQKILVVEDEIVNQILIEAILEQEGLVVRLVNDGLEAVEACRQERFDLILMDIQMPNLDGYGATIKIRKLAKGFDVPIIALSAHAMKGVKEKCLAGGMNGYVSKPISRDELIMTIGSWLAGS